MPVNSKKLEIINQKIANLQKLQKKIEDDFIQNISKDVAKILIKKRAYHIDKAIFLKKLESLVDNMQKD